MTDKDCNGNCKPRCRECRQANALAYRRENPHRSWIGGYRDRMRKYGLEDQIVVEVFTRADVIFRYGNACSYCANGEFEELDHVIPVCQAGPHTLNNVRPTCATCNGRKSKVDGCPEDRRAS